MNAAEGVRAIAVLGASRQREKYGNRAVRAYRAEGWKVYPINPNADQIEGLPAFPSISAVPGPVDRVSAYLPPEKLLPLLEEIAAKRVGELFLNPGAESSEVISRAQELGVPVVLACSIVDIGRSPLRPD